MATTTFGLLEFLLMSVLMPGPPGTAPAYLAAAGAAIWTAGDEVPSAPVAVEPAAPAPTAADFALFRLEPGQGNAATGELILCRVGGKFLGAPDCPSELFVGKESRVFNGAAGEVGRWSVPAAAEPLPTPEGGAPNVRQFAGTLGQPLPKAAEGWDEAMTAPFALAGDARHALERPSGEKLSRAIVEPMMERGRRVTRMNPGMSAGMEPTQWVVTDLTPELLDAVILAASNYPTGPLADAPRPSASMLHAHIRNASESGGTLDRWIALQVISKASDQRKFERYRLAAILDLDSDGERELLVRARSERGDRYRVFKVGDGRRAKPLGPWAGGIFQPAGAPGNK